AVARPFRRRHAWGFRRQFTPNLLWGRAAADTIDFQFTRDIRLALQTAATSRVLRQGPIVTAARPVNDINRHIRIWTLKRTDPERTVMLNRDEKIRSLAVPVHCTEDLLGPCRLLTLLRTE